MVQLASSTGAVIKTYHYDAFGVEISPETNDIYHGGTFLIGIGVPIPAELHGEVAKFFVYGFNVFDEMKTVYNNIMEW